MRSIWCASGGDRLWSRRLPVAAKSCLVSKGIWKHEAHCIRLSVYRGACGGRSWTRTFSAAFGDEGTQHSDADHHPDDAADDAAGHPDVAYTVPPDLHCAALPST